MRYLPLAALAAAIAVVTPIAFAGDPAPSNPPAIPAPAPSTGPALEPPPIAPVAAPALPAHCRAEVLPARTAWVERTVTIPEKTREECVPVYETVKVPTFEERRVPEYRDVQVPVHATREVPCFEERAVPRYGAVEVPVFTEVRKPVGFSLWNPFDCEDRCLDVHLWDTCEQVPCGTEVRQEIVGYDTERVQVGTQTETFVSGYETRRELVGERCETVQVGERDEPRLVGWRTEVTVIEPARTETVRECVQLPAETVTVVSSGDPAATPGLPGTLRVLSEDDFRREHAAAR